MNKETGAKRKKPSKKRFKNPINNIGNKHICRLCNGLMGWTGIALIVFLIYLIGKGLTYTKIGTIIAMTGVVLFLFYVLGVGIEEGV